MQPGADRVVRTTPQDCPRRSRQTVRIRASPVGCSAPPMAHGRPMLEAEIKTGQGRVRGCIVTWGSICGAGDGNRTRTISLEDPPGCHTRLGQSRIEPHLLVDGEPDGDRDGSSAVGTGQIPVTECRTKFASASPSPQLTTALAC